MTDKEIKEVAEKASENIKIAYHQLAYPAGQIYKDIKEALVQVRDDQENKIATLEANEAVQNALIVDLSNQIKIARGALKLARSYIVANNHGDTQECFIIEDALLKLGSE